jgi:hypothetical protein
MLVKKIEIKSSSSPILSYSKRSEKNPESYTIATRIVKETGEFEYDLYIIDMGKSIKIDDGIAKEQFILLEKQYDEHQTTRQNLINELRIALNKETKVLEAEYAAEQALKSKCEKKEERVEGMTTTRYIQKKDGIERYAKRVRTLDGYKYFEAYIKSGAKKTRPPIPEELFEKLSKIHSDENPTKKAA